jgi:hypothetical protein
MDDVDFSKKQIYESTMQRAFTRAFSAVAKAPRVSIEYCGRW